MKIGIIGGGVSGVTTALAMQEAGFDSCILTNEPFECSTTWAAGAVCYPSGCEETERSLEWFLQTHQKLEALKDIAEAGIFLTDWRKFSINDECEVPFWLDHFKGGRVLNADECDAPYQSGIAAPIFIMNVDMYFPWLLRRFISAGGEVRIREVGSLDELAGDFDALINCTGVHARDFVQDEAVYPARGQAVIVKNPGVSRHISLFDRSFYIYPRGEQCLLGGSFDVGEWDRKPDEELTQQIIQWAGEMEPLLKEPEILDVRVGLRPMRQEVRLECEDVGSTPVIHNYGHGGSGYALSWGCASDVVSLVQSI